MTMPEPSAEQSQDWFFTFGFDHTHPDTDERLNNSYVHLHGTCDETRAQMFAVFGNRWSHQYPLSQRAVAIGRFGLTLIDMPAARVDAGEA
jgi:hypothetical protein